MSILYVFVAVVLSAVYGADPSKLQYYLEQELTFPAYPALGVKIEFWFDGPKQMSKYRQVANWDDASVGLFYFNLTSFSHGGEYWTYMPKQDGNGEIQCLHHTIIYPIPKAVRASLTNPAGGDGYVKSTLFEGKLVDMYASGDGYSYVDSSTQRPLFSTSGSGEKAIKIRYVKYSANVDDAELEIPTHIPCASNAAPGLFRSQSRFS